MISKRKGQARRRQPFKPSFGWLRPALAALTVAGSALGLTLMSEWMHDPQAWPVKRVHIEGKFQHLHKAQIRAVAAAPAAAGFFVVDVGDLQARLQALAWVDQVSVRRIWPDELDIQVREQRPVARWGAASFINARAEVFTPDTPVLLDDLPALDGPEGNQLRVLEMHYRLQALLRPLQLDVSAITLTARRAWRLRLNNGLRLEVGRRDPLQRVARFVRVYPAILASGAGELTSVDLRYSNGFAVRWNRAKTTTQQTG